MFGFGRLKTPTRPESRRTARAALAARVATWIVLAIAITPLGPMRADAFLIELASRDFAERTNVFSGVTSFTISIEVAGPLRTGVFANPEIGDIEFLVRGALDPSTPARQANPAFTGFAVDDRAALRGQAFYDQGNSLNFEIASTANLMDGLQVSELVGTGLVFEFDGRELGTGRYHPPIIQLMSDGTGSIRNSNNTGGINPFTGVEVNVEIGDEYVTTLGFEPSGLSIVVPEPSVGLLLGFGLATLSYRKRGR